MFHLAFGVKQGLCDEDLLAISSTENFPCYDMASGLYGDFVADGEVNLFDLSLFLRMLYGGTEMAEYYMANSSTTDWKCARPAPPPIVLLLLLLSLLASC